MSRRPYPIILGGGNLKKGLMAVPGARFGIEDIQSVQQVIHFTDRKTLERTVWMLTCVLNDWKEEDGESENHS